MSAPFQIFSDDHRMIGEVVDRLFTDLAAADAAERLKTERRLDPAAVDSALAGIGIVAGAEPDPMMSSALIQSQVTLAAGTACLAYPLLETLLVQALAAAAGHAVPVCGVSTAFPAMPSSATSGMITLPRVAFATHYQHVLVPTAGGGLGLLPLDTAGLTKRAVQSVEPDYALDDITVPAAALAGAAAVADAAVAVALRQRASLLAAAEIAGACRTMIKMTRDHLLSREQFGRPLGSYQALKHRIADAYVQTEALVPAISYAAAAADADDDEAPALVAGVKLFAGNAGKFVAEAAMQLHGAIGYTFDYPLHLYMRRAHRLGSSYGARAALEAGLLQEFAREGIPDLGIPSGDNR